MRSASAGPVAGCGLQKRATKLHGVRECTRRSGLAREIASASGFRACMAPLLHDSRVMIARRISGEKSAEPQKVGIKLLVIDDDDSFREALSELLRSDGFEVDTANHATAAVLQLQTKEFDAVLSDLVMPGNGHLVVEYVHSHQPNTPVIVISSHASPRQALANRGWRSVACLSKPVHFAQVLEALEQAIDGRAPAFD